MPSRKSISAAAIAVLVSAVLNQHARGDFLAGEFVTYSQDAWGTIGTPASDLLVNHFFTVFTFGFAEIGIPGAGGFSAAFTSAQDVMDYLPTTGVPGALDNDLVNPTSTTSGIFGGYTLALLCNVAVNDAGLLAGSSSILFGDLILVDMIDDFGAGEVDMSALNGLTVRQFLDLAHIQIGGGGGTFSFDEISAVTNQFSLAFENGQPSDFALQHLAVPEPADVNFDGVVDIFDVNLVSAHWGEAGPTADANQDGIVDIFDVNLISAHWTASGASAVPEPSTISTAVVGLAVVGLMALVSRRTAARL